MIVQAVREGGDTVDGMVAALEGWTFDSVKGEITVREDDHAMIQPMYQAKLVQDGATGCPSSSTRSTPRGRAAGRRRKPAALRPGPAVAPERGRRPRPITLHSRRQP